MSVQPILFDTLRFTTKKYVFANKDVPAYNSNLIVIENDRVAIGTASPDPNYVCTIQGNTIIRGSLDVGYIDAPSSNLGYLVLPGSDSYPTINVIQQTAQPYMLLRDPASNVVTFFDANGNLGIGTTIAYQSLVVNGTIAASNIELLGGASDAKNFQLQPLQQLFTIETAERTIFTLQTTGYYTTTPHRTHVYWNGFKLAYYSPTYRDYTVTTAYDEPTNQTTFTITLLRAANFKDVVDIVIWPDMPNTPGTGKYIQTVDFSYWAKAGNALYINQPVGIHTTLPQYDLHINGTTYTSNLITSLLTTTDLNIPHLDAITITTQDLITQSISIGSTTLPPNVSYYVSGNMQLQNGTLQLSSNSQLIFEDGTIISSSNNSATVQATTVLYSNGASLQNNILRANALAIAYPATNPPPNTLLINGNLGIGTTTPQYPLDINGSIQISGAIYSNNNVLYTASQWANHPNGIFYMGNVGIGTTVPRVPLEVQGNVTLTGNLGIGTTLPTAALDIRGNCTVTGNIRSPTFVGMVSYFAAATPPVGWLECNGQSVSRTTYADLFSYIGTTYGSLSGSTFNLPDLRGEFIRGWDNGRGLDVGRVFGSAQGYAMENHGHVWNYTTVSGGGSSNLATVFTTASGTVSNAVGTVTSAATSTETRPRNVALLPCIKF